MTGVRVCGALHGTTERFCFCGRSFVVKLAGNENARISSPIATLSLYLIRNEYRLYDTSTETMIFSHTHTRARTTSKR